MADNEQKWEEKLKGKQLVDDDSFDASEADKKVRFLLLFLLLLLLFLLIPLFHVLPFSAPAIVKPNLCD